MKNGQFGKFYQDEEDIVKLAKELLFKGGETLLAEAQIGRVGYQALDSWNRIRSHSSLM